MLGYFVAVETGDSAQKIWKFFIIAKICPFLKLDVQIRPQEVFQD